MKGTDVLRRCLGCMARAVISIVLALAKHPDLAPFQVKHLLYLTAANVSGAGR